MSDSDVIWGNVPDGVVSSSLVVSGEHARMLNALSQAGHVDISHGGSPSKVASVATGVLKKGSLTI